MEDKVYVLVENGYVSIDFFPHSWLFYFFARLANSFFFLYFIKNTSGFCNLGLRMGIEWSLQRFFFVDFVDGKMYKIDGNK